MRFSEKVLVSVALTVCLASTASAATIAGSVQGPDGKPFMGAFVVAENTRNKMTVSVLSDAQGRYHIGNLPAATYRVQIATAGYKSTPRTDVRLVGRPEGLVRLCAAKDVGALERSQHVSGQAASAQDQEPRPQLSGRVFYDLPPILPLVSEAHGFLRLG